MEKPLARRLSLRPETSELRRLNLWLDEAFGEADLDAEIAGDLKLCLNEAVENVIRYAFDAEPDPQVAVELCLDREGSAVAELEDNGRPFNPLDWPRREKPVSLDGDGIGGFGIHLIREVAREVAYRRDGGRNRLRITCRAD